MGVVASFWAIAIRVRVRSIPVHFLLILRWRKHVLMLLLPVHILVEAVLGQLT